MRRWLALIPVVVLVGCGSGDGYGVVKDPSVTPLPDFKTLTKEQKIERINRLPIPDEAKRDQIARVNAGQL